MLLWLWQIKGLTIPPHQNSALLKHVKYTDPTNPKMNLANPIISEELLTIIARHLRGRRQPSGALPACSRLKVAPRLRDRHLSPLLKGFRSCSRSISPGGKGRRERCSPHLRPQHVRPPSPGSKCSDRSPLEPPRRLDEELSMQTMCWCETHMTSHAHTWMRHGRSFMHEPEAAGQSLTSKV